LKSKSKDWNKIEFQDFIKPDEKCGDKYCIACNSGLDYTIDKMDSYLSKQIDRYLNPNERITIFLRKVF